MYCLGSENAFRWSSYCRHPVDDYACVEVCKVPLLLPLGLQLKVELGPELGVKQAAEHREVFKMNRRDLL